MHCLLRRSPRASAHTRSVAVAPQLTMEIFIILKHTSSHYTYMYRSMMDVQRHDQGDAADQSEMYRNYV